MTAQRQGGFGIAYEDTPGTAETAPVYYLTGESQNIEMEPNTYERINSLGAERIGVESSGYAVTVPFSGIETGVEPLGYLFWLALGDVATVTSEHTITPVFDSHYFTALKWFGGDYSAINLETQQAIKCRLDSLSLSQARFEYAKVGGGAMGTKQAGVGTSLSPSLDLTANAAPLSWATLTSVELNVNNGGFNSVDIVSGFSIDLARELTPTGYLISDNQPSEMSQGGRTVDFEVTFDFTAGSSSLITLIPALTGGQNVGLKVTYTAGSNSIIITIPNATVTGNIAGPLGPAADPQEFTLTCQGYQSGSDDVITVVAEDGNTTGYAAR